MLACTASSRSFSAFAFLVSAILARVASFFLSLSAFSSIMRFFVSLSAATSAARCANVFFLRIAGSVDLFVAFFAVFQTRPETRVSGFEPDDSADADGWTVASTPIF
ncbi:hypothetical protein AYI70_g1811 [Smittium culicis]|uniref:Uncharacterized protein n=1 Tax=Smittium culicis TaxID=133412 RepID=A0A1R1YB54_9FUNG|nr:hypothetical protein AYI70_g1811 [Smittium culicis]